MNIHDDFEEFLRFLTKANAKFVVVGGYAVAHHGYIRATGDLDIFYELSVENAEPISKALLEFGFSDSAIDRELFMKEGNIVRMGVSPERIELINRISGITFEEVWSNRIKGRYGDVEVFFISLENLLTNKRASGRPKDLIDVDELTSSDG